MQKIRLLIAVLIANFLLSIAGNLPYFKTLFNNLFLTSLLLLMIGGSLLILEGGFFNKMIYGFKKYYNKVSSVGRYVAEETNESEEVAPFKFSATHMLLKVGGLLFVTTFLIGWIF